MTWSPISFGLTNTVDDTQELMRKLLVKNLKYIKGADNVGPSESSETETKLMQLNSLAEKHSCTLAQLCIAWTVRNQTGACVIASSASVEQFYDILNSLPVRGSLIRVI